MIKTIVVLNNYSLKQYITAFYTRQLTVSRTNIFFGKIVETNLSVSIDL